MDDDLTKRLRNHGNWKVSHPHLGLVADDCVAAADRIERLETEIDGLAKVLLEEFGGPTQDESACEMAVRVLRRLEAALRQIHDEPQGTWHGEEYDKCVPSKDYFISVVEWCRETARRALDGEGNDA